MYDAWAPPTSCSNAETAADVALALAVEARASQWMLLSEQESCRGRADAPITTAK